MNMVQMEAEEAKRNGAKFYIVGYYDASNESAIFLGGYKTREEAINAGKEYEASDEYETIHVCNEDAEILECYHASWYEEPSSECGEEGYW